MSTAVAVIPVSLKLVTSIIRRAEEIEKDPNSDYESKVVAYYCRLDILIILFASH